MVTPPASEPFAINRQYKVNMLEEQDEGGGDQNLDPTTVEPNVKRRKVASKPGPRAKPAPKKNPESCDAATGYAPKDYTVKKSAFIRKLKDEEGISHSEASKRWDDSPLKKELLSTLSASELIRRRFVPKGTTTNPWAWLRVRWACGCTIWYTCVPTNSYVLGLLFNIHCMVLRSLGKSLKSGLHSPIRIKIGQSSQTCHQFQVFWQRLLWGNHGELLFNITIVRDRKFTYMIAANDWRST